MYQRYPRRIRIRVRPQCISDVAAVAGRKLSVSAAGHAVLSVFSFTRIARCHAVNSARTANSTAISRLYATEPRTSGIGWASARTPWTERRPIASSSGWPCTSRNSRTIGFQLTEPMTTRACVHRPAGIDANRSGGVDGWYLEHVARHVFEKRRAAARRQRLDFDADHHLGPREPLRKKIRQRGDTPPLRPGDGTRHLNASSATGRSKPPISGPCCRLW